MGNNNNTEEQTLIPQVSNKTSLYFITINIPSFILAIMSMIVCIIYIKADCGTFIKLPLWLFISAFIIFTISFIAFIDKKYETNYRKSYISYTLHLFIF